MTEPSQTFGSEAEEAEKSRHAFNRALRLKLMVCKVSRRSSYHQRYAGKKPVEQMLAAIINALYEQATAPDVGKTDIIKFTSNDSKDTKNLMTGLFTYGTWPRGAVIDAFRRMVRGIVLAGIPDPAAKAFASTRLVANEICDYFAPAGYDQPSNLPYFEEKRWACNSPYDRSEIASVIDWAADFCNYHQKGDVEKQATPARLWYVVADSTDPLILNHDSILGSVKRAGAAGHLKIVLLYPDHLQKQPVGFKLRQLAEQYPLSCEARKVDQKLSWFHPIFAYMMRESLIETRELDDVKKRLWIIRPHSADHERRHTPISLTASTEELQLFEDWLKASQPVSKSSRPRKVR